LVIEHHGTIRRERLQRFQVVMPCTGTAVEREKRNRVASAHDTIPHLALGYRDIAFAHLIGPHIWSRCRCVAEDLLAEGFAGPSFTLLGLSTVIRSTL